MGGSASMRAATLVNAEQAPKRVMRKSTAAVKRGRLPSAGKRATSALAGSAGVLAAARIQEGDGRNTGSPVGGVHATRPGRTDPAERITAKAAVAVER